MRRHYISAPKALSLEELAQRCDLVAIEARFWSKVDRRGPDECWLWQGCWNERGYGVFNLGGRTRIAPRVAYLLAHGALPAGVFVCHDCPGGRDNPRCVNPAHLFLGTNAENVADYGRKSRARNRTTGRLAPPILRYVAKPRPKRAPRLPRPRLTLAQRLEAGLDKSGECWLWTRGADKDGYGVISGRNRGKSYWFRAHRLAYELAYGAIPPGMVVCHRCDMPGCCYPAHLFLGTSADNIRDRDAKGHTRKPGRHPNRAVGERVNTAKLQATDIAVIRGRALTEDYARIAADFGIRRGTVAQIAQRRSWAHLPPAAGVPTGGRDMRYKQALSAEQSAEVVARYLAGGVTQEELGTAYGVSFATVRRVLHRAGVRRGPGGRIL